ncbi:MAG: BrnT family toxin [Candidatus Electrothrix sp. AUS1_2]|nr:BrnT family toxin [Candidatus Electrothrix sp. AUS1_2]
MKLNFEWDEKKAKSNRKKHGIGFDEAATVSLFLLMDMPTAHRWL